LFLLEHSEQPLLTLERILFPFLYVIQFPFEHSDALLIEVNNF